MHKILLFKILGILVLLQTSCVDREFTNIVDNSYYTPIYSLPVGMYTFKMDSVASEYSDYFIEVPDSLSDSDSLFIINYDSLFYNTPVFFDFAMTNNFDYSMFNENIDYITLLMFRLNCINKIPGKVFVQVYFLDAFENPLDSLYKQGWLEIEAATVNADGSLNKATELWKHDTYVDSTTINRLRNVYFIEVFSRLEVEHYTIAHIKYLPDQEFWSQFAFKIQFELPLNEI